MNQAKLVRQRSAQPDRKRSSDQCPFIELNGDNFLRIANVHLMPEFMMSLTGSSDHWMFITSAGAVTAGRRDANNALFPYYSADKISDMRSSIGPRTIIRVGAGSLATVWEPFAVDNQIPLGVVRNLYKNTAGNKLVFEEMNPELGLMFQYRWTFSHESGFIRTSQLMSFGHQPMRLEVLDGLLNILPCGVDQNFQLRFSNLADAYKRNELLEDVGAGLYYLSSIPSDRAEPSEGLRATVVWNTQAPQAILLTDRQLAGFRSGQGVQTERETRGIRGAYLLNYSLEILPEQAFEWDIVADVGLDQSQVVDLVDRIKQPQPVTRLRREIDECQRRLNLLIAAADGIQRGGNRARVQRHQSNVMFNIMRGGIPLNGYQIDRTDCLSHVRKINRLVAERNDVWMSGLPAEIHRDDLIEQVKACGDDDLLRIAMEYLPFIFSRRHGDPTRPWNMFAIHSHFGGEERTYSYQGNWRDIFQNWEALAHAYPEYLDGMICRFLNASTVDGHNPYRVTICGFEWEVPEPTDPWSNIGYWGDHQIVYLCRLLEMLQDYFPGRLNEWTARDVFVFADVPYRIKAANEILRNPFDTVVYDEVRAADLAQRVATIGSDGKLLCDSEHRIVTANLVEKLLLPGLTKLTNFVPGGGIWMNTQRPEWNDANNALVGNGLSVVTTCHLRRYFSFLIQWLESLPSDELSIRPELERLLKRIELALSPVSNGDGCEMTASQRYRIVVDLLDAGSDYRQLVYRAGLSDARVRVPLEQCCRSLRTIVEMLDATILANRRSDGLFHSYNLLLRDIPGEFHLERLDEMLEGQVALLSSGLLNTEQALAVLDALRSSRIFLPEKQGYLLYPDRRLPQFLEKNHLPADWIDQSPLIMRLLAESNDAIVRRDCHGQCHFNGDFRNASDVKRAVESLRASGRYEEVIDGAAEQLARMFENLFCHHRFTGRSGTFFAYEGLGSIYWHMVSKLALVTMETIVLARVSGADRELLDRLMQHYREIRTGIGAEKSPQQYGAFPTDPYSHTPAHAGAQQPGMTGQVKEDILSRFLEIGVRIRGGQISFDPSMLDADEYTNQPDDHSIRTSAATMPHFGFTLCGTQVAYSWSGENSLTIFYRDGRRESLREFRLSESQSRSVFARNGDMTRIEITIDPLAFQSQ